SPSPAARQLPWFAVASRRRKAMGVQGDRAKQAMRSLRNQAMPATGLTAVTSSSVSVRELTVRGLILGMLITTVFTAANVYLGLKVGLTFATSIPAAVISMAVLSAFKESSILENNIVQTVASAAGTLSAIIFVDRKSTRL